MVDRLERWLRLPGAAGIAAFVGLALAGLWRGSRRQIGRTVGSAPPGLWSARFYLLASLATVWLLRWLWRPLPMRLSERKRVATLALGALLYFPGLALMVWGRLALGEMYNVSSGLGARLYAGHRLVTSGPYALVRHPMYLGGQMAELGALLMYRTWGSLLIALNIPALALRARREEEALAAEFGDEWTAYAERVPGWLPLRL